MTRRKKNINKRIIVDPIPKISELASKKLCGRKCGELLIRSWE